MKYLQNITSDKKLNNYRPLVAYDAEEDKVYYLPFENLPPFTIIAVSDITVSMSRNVIQYSYDGLQWQDLPVGDSFSASAGDKVYVRCSSPSVEYPYGIGTLSVTGTFNVAGNIMSLVNDDNYNTDYSIHKVYQFMALLCGNTGLLDASELILPATNLKAGCYESMFEGCTSLVNAPELPATTLAIQCYDYMFQGCENLTYIKALFLTEPSNSYTYLWVDGVASTGTFVKNAEATWNVVGKTGIPTGWTVETAAA